MSTVIDFSRVVPYQCSDSLRPVYTKLKKTFLTSNIVPSDVFIESGFGARLKTDHGEIIDFCSMTVNCILGQNDPWVKSQLISYLLSEAPSFHSTRFSSDVYFSLPYRLAQLKIAGIAQPVINHRQCSGSDASELAIKLAYNQRQGRSKVISLSGSYHGQNMTDFLISDTQKKHRFLISDQNVFFSLTPEYAEFYDSNISEKNHEILAQIRYEAKDAFAIIIEPIQMNNGVNVLGLGFIKKLRQIADEFDCCLIFDEIQTGFGWLGKLSAAEAMGVVPDIFCGSKALTSGWGALSLTASNAKYSDLDYGAGEKTSGSDIRSVVAANAVLDRLLGIPETQIPDYVNEPLRSELKTGLINLVPNKENFLRQELKKLQAAYPNTIKQIRGEGLMLGLELLDADGSPAFELADKLVNEALNKGVFIKATKNVIIVKPPLVITDDEIKVAIERLYQAFASCLGIRGMGKIHTPFNKNAQSF